jgi:hypothetical protein
MAAATADKTIAKMISPIVRCERAVDIPKRHIITDPMQRSMTAIKGNIMATSP